MMGRAVSVLGTALLLWLVLRHGSRDLVSDEGSVSRCDVMERTL